MKLTVVTYNLLSPAYVKPSYFPNIEEEYIKELKKAYANIGKNLDNFLELQSAHLKLYGHEPVYTNISSKSEGEMFVECLDYCLVTKSVGVKKCIVEYVIENPCATSYPNNFCPSDHQPLVTTLLV